jgi:tRNA(fMet)-specific endonuclease VapC
MTLGGNELIALDTNTVVHWVRQDANGKRILAQYGLDRRQERPILSSIVEGELRGLARCWNWGAAKLKRLDDIFGELVRVDAGHADIVLHYANLYFEDQQGGHNTGENDLWIAATAKATGATLLTCDGDFAWMSPRLVSVEIVAQGN